MFTGLVIGALSAAALMPQTDTIVQANGASRLELEVFQGEVMVRTWDRDAVQVKTGSSDSPSIEVDRSGRTLSVSVDMERAHDFAHGVDFEITVPLSASSFSKTASLPTTAKMDYAAYRMLTRMTSSSVVLVEPI